jgi:predicted anti-sigma-YlaC factor YlaD
MSPVSGPHLTPEDLDAWLAGVLAPAAQEHLAGCPACRERAETEGEIVSLIAALPLVSPAAGFADRVMTRVAVTQPLRVRTIDLIRQRVFASRRSLAFAVSLLVLVTGSMAGSIVWTLGHRETLTALGSWLTAQAGQAAWLGVRGVASNFIEQPWFAGFRELAASPGRLGIATGFALVAYLSGVLALRRLLALPTPRVAHASA